MTSAPFTPEQEERVGDLVRRIVGDVLRSSDGRLRTHVDACATCATAATVSRTATAAADAAAAFTDRCVVKTDHPS
jgi:hypothetical protein